jgi:hypothetical protein
MLLVLEWQHTGSLILWNIQAHCSELKHPKMLTMYSQYAELIGETAMSRGLKATLSLCPTEATVRDMGQGYLHRLYMYDYHRVIGLAAVKEEARKG